MKLSEVRKHDLHIKELYSNYLDVINESLQSKNYDYCFAGVTRLQGFCEWKRTVACVPLITSVDKEQLDELVCKLSNEEMIQLEQGMYNLLNF